MVWKLFGNCSEIVRKWSVDLKTVDPQIVDPQTVDPQTIDPQKWFGNGSAMVPK